MDALGIEQRDRRRLRLGSANRRHRRRALAGTLQRPGLGERLPDRQPGRRASCRCRRRPSCSGGTSTTSPPSAAGPATTSTGASSRSSSGGPRRRSGTSTTRRSIAARRRSTTPTTSTIVIHNYRWRLGLADGEPEYDELEQRLAEGPVITVPTITLEGDANGAPHPEPERLRREVLGHVLAPDDRGRHRAQPSPGSAGGVRRCRPRSGRSTEVSLVQQGTRRRAPRYPSRATCPASTGRPAGSTRRRSRRRTCAGRSCSSTSGRTPASTGSARSATSARGPRSTRIRGWSWSASTRRSSRSSGRRQRPPRPRRT